MDTLLFHSVPRAQHLICALLVAAPFLCSGTVFSLGYLLPMLPMSSSTEHCLEFASEHNNSTHTQFSGSAADCLQADSVCEALWCNVQEDHGVQVQALQSVPRSICTLLKVSLLAPVSDCFYIVPPRLLYSMPTECLPTESLHSVPKSC